MIGQPIKQQMVFCPREMIFVLHRHSTKYEVLQVCQSDANCSVLKKLENSLLRYYITAYFFDSAASFWIVLSAM